ncbi:hypothetical protein [Halomonas halocynthiae]|uniref:hypothetical protein n=1 Tax=Halomonas halocynthiae TaxID=176290 RepID=UPI00040A0D1E|nr:hypothetical protein [Halomonas halocynthiae]
MTLRTHAVALTGSDQTVVTVPEGQEATCNSILCTGSGSLTLKYKEANGTEHTVFSSKSITDEIALERSFNLSAGDSLIASGSGLSIFISAYYVGSSSGSAVMAFGPGPQVLKAGDMQAGYFGEVSAAEFYSGNRLALELGVTEGTLQNSEAGWLKFASKGKVLFVAKQTFMHSVAWDHLYSRGIVYGTDDVGISPRGTPTNQMTTVDHGGNKFIVRLMTGANADPFPESDPLYLTEDMCQMDIGGGGEWNTLMYRVHQDIPDCPDTIGMTADRHSGPQVGDNWANFTNSDLNIGSGSGRNVWCQEASDTIERFRALRGNVDVTHFGNNDAANSSLSHGWRPVLELVV